MEDFPSRSHLVFQYNSHIGALLIAIGYYKYNNHKVLNFIATKKASSTPPRRPCKVKFPDKCDMY